jgi:hypothetical protein
MSEQDALADGRGAPGAAARRARAAAGEGRRDALSEIRNTALQPRFRGLYTALLRRPARTEEGPPNRVRQDLEPCVQPGRGVYSEVSSQRIRL